METKSLKEIAIVEYGKSPKHVKTKNSDVPIFGTGGQVGYSKEILFEGPLTVIARKGTLNKPIYYEHGCWIIDTAYGVTCKEEFNAKWLYYNFQNFELASLNEATGVPSINRNALYNIKFLVPSLPEQKKIADILTTVDDKISSIDSRIQQTEKLKKGLMEKLLTEGIGRIPVGWSVKNINKISDRKSGHTPNRKISEYWNGGIKWVSLADTFRLDKRYIEDTEYNISEAGILNSSAVKLKKGAVIISRDAGIGKSAIIGHSMAVSQHFIAWECGNALFNLFLFYLLQKWKPKFERIANGTTIKTIGLDFFKKMEIPLPPLPEQKQIATILSTVDDKLDILTQKKSRYQTLKKGLSQQLLTGQMRVKV